MERVNPFDPAVQRWRGVGDYLSGLPFLGRFFGSLCGPVNTRQIEGLSRAAEVQLELLNPPTGRTPRTRVGFVAELVAETKAKLGNEPRTAVNELWARKFLCKEMKDHGMSGTQIMEQIELALNCVFLLNDHQKVALALSATRGFEDDARLKKWGYVTWAGFHKMTSRKAAPPK